MSSIIPKEQLANYQRWQMGSFDSPAKIEAPAPDHAGLSTEAEHPTAPSEEEVSSMVPLPTAEDIERIHEEARNEGYQTGLAEGRAAAQAENAEIIAAEISKISGLIGNLQQALQSIDQSVAEQLLDLALEVAGQVLRGTVTTRRETLLPVIREAIAALPLHHAHIQLFLNPADAAVVREQIGEQIAQSGGQIIEDAGIADGGCQLKAGASEIDATLEMRWKRVIQAIGTNPKDWQPDS